MAMKTTSIAGHGLNHGLQPITSVANSVIGQDSVAGNSAARTHLPPKYVLKAATSTLFSHAATDEPRPLIPIATAAPAPRSGTVSIKKTDPRELVSSLDSHSDLLSHISPEDLRTLITLTCSDQSPNFQVATMLSLRVSRLFVAGLQHQARLGNAEALDALMWLAANNLTEERRVHRSPLDTSISRYLDVTESAHQALIDILLSVDVDYFSENPNLYSEVIASLSKKSGPHNLYGFDGNIFLETLLMQWQEKQADVPSRNVPQLYAGIIYLSNFLKSINTPPVDTVYYMLGQLTASNKPDLVSIESRPKVDWIYGPEQDEYTGIATRARSHDVDACLELFDAVKEGKPGAYSALTSVLLSFESHILIERILSINPSARDVERPSAKLLGYAVRELYNHCDETFSNKAAEALVDLLLAQGDEAPIIYSQIFKWIFEVDSSDGFVAASSLTSKILTGLKSAADRSKDRTWLIEQVAGLIEKSGGTSPNTDFKLVQELFEVSNGSPKQNQAVARALTAFAKRLNRYGVDKDAAIRQKGIQLAQQLGLPDKQKADLILLLEPTLGRQLLAWAANFTS